MNDAAGHIWRSPVADSLAAAGARFEAVDDGAVAETVPGGDLNQAAHLGLADLSPLPRLGVKGRSTLPWLEAEGLPLPADNNRWVETAEGEAVVRLGPGEILMLSPLHGDGRTLQRLEAANRETAPQLCYPVPRRDSHAWFRVTGQRAPALFARLCAVDLRSDRFPADGVAQTFVAAITAIVVRADIGPPGRQAPGFHLLMDVASAGWLWEIVSATMKDLGGGPVGRGALSQLAATGIDPSRPLP